jgi:predicted O-methyltransferase YrrM
MITISQAEIFNWEEMDKAVKCYEWPPENMMTTMERRLVLSLALKYDQGLNKVEIGTHNGFTTFVLSRGFPDRKIHTVDLLPEVDHAEQPGVHLGHHYKSNQCGNVVQHLRKGTEDIFESFAPYDFVLIDGDHSPESVKTDFNNAMQFLEGGLVILDDCFMPGPTKLINEFCDNVWNVISNTKLAYGIF